MRSLQKMKLVLLKSINAFGSVGIAAEKYFHEHLDHYDARFFRAPVEAVRRHEILINLLKEFSALCAKERISPVLMHGGLLGWYWNKKLLPWDDDIDICLFYQDLCRLNSSKTCLDYNRSSFMLDINPNHVQRGSKNLHNHQVYEPNRIDARFIDKTTGLYLDITALSASFLGFYTKCPHVYKKNDLVPLRATLLEGIRIFVPNHVRTVLTQEYGDESVVSTTYRNHFFDKEAHLWYTAESETLHSLNRPGFIGGSQS